MRKVRIRPLSEKYVICWEGSGRTNRQLLKMGSRNLRIASRQLRSYAPLSPLENSWLRHWTKVRVLESTNDTVSELLFADWKCPFCRNIELIISLINFYTKILNGHYQQTFEMTIISFHASTEALLLGVYQVRNVRVDDYDEVSCSVGWLLPDFILRCCCCITIMP